MTKFNLEIDCHNAAFTPDLSYELERLLELVKQDVIEGCRGGLLYDVNGNGVGVWNITPDEEEEEEEEGACFPGLRHYWVDNGEISYCEICGADGNG